MFILIILLTVIIVVMIITVMIMILINITKIHSVSEPLPVIYISHTLDNEVPEPPRHTPHLQAGPAVHVTQCKCVSRN